MPTTTVYVLHKNGAKSHYTGLKKLLENHNIQLQHREFSIVGKFVKALFKWQPKLLLKQCINLLFFIKLLVSKNVVIVLGIAPFDKKLQRLLPFLSRHQVYYHTSWTHWDKTFHPKVKGNSKSVFKDWKHFLEKKAKHIFCVTETSKKALLTNYNLSEDNLSVVYHALSNEFTHTSKVRRPIPNSFIYYGRVVKSKGISEILETFSKLPDTKLTILGQGALSPMAITFSEQFKNIEYVPKTNNKERLISILRSHEFVILNSKTTKKWEELFGLIIIEGMSQGLIPIAPKHSGPKEIITDNSGFLFEEGNLDTCIKDILSSSIDKTTHSRNAILKSRTYQAERIAKHWSPILSSL